MKHNTLRLCILVATMFLFRDGSAAEKRIRKADLPAPVQQAAEKETKGATVRGYSTEVEDGQREYEVETTVNGHSRDITFAPDGTLLELEEQVDLNDLPASVRDGLKAKANSGTITKVESISKQGKIVAYEAKVVKGNKRSEIQVDPDGKPLTHPE